MNSKKVVLSLFLVVALVQLYVPARMILDQEDVLQTGKLFKFKTAPIDPNDPFRGKYIILSFDRTSLTVEHDSLWEYNERAFVKLKEGEDGFAYPSTISKSEPEDTPDYLEVSISSTYKNQVFIIYPFDRFYMEETKAPVAESIYLEAQVDTTSIAYASVAVKEGKGVISDVFIDDVPIKEVVEKVQEAENTP